MKNKGQVDVEQLKDSLEFFDGMLQQLIGDPPEDFNVKRFGKHYNVLRNALALYMKQEDE